MRFILNAYLGAVFCVILPIRFKRDFMEYWGGGAGEGGGKVQNIWGGGGQGGQTFFAGCNLISAPAPNQCQIITFLTLKTDNIAKLRWMDDG